MNYRYLGGNLYEIKLTVYRDCYNGVAPFDNPASIGIFNSSNVLVARIDATINDQQQVSNAINTPCLIPPSDVCYEVAHYIFTTSLPPVPGGYSIVYQRCCRNSTIINLANVNSTGATYLATIPDPSLAAYNSNPVFNSSPPTFICQNAPFTYDQSATDPDGDSLAYELCTPYDGADQFNPQPQPPNPPPYNSVTYLPPYSLSNILGGTPLTIDPESGILKATPSSNGQYVYGVRVKEYRNGQFISESTRDFQVNVVPCPQITVASIFSPTIVCGSLRADFTNNSYNAATYSWNFGDITTQADTSNLQSPSWLYPDTGIYTTTLIAYSGINPDCNDTAVGIVKVYPVFNALFNFSNLRCDPDFQFEDLSYGIGGTASFWDWSFGDGQTSDLQNPVHTYSTPGLYDVQLITSTDSACLDTMKQTISVLQVPTASFTTSLDTCKQQVSIVNTSQFASTFQWDFGDAFVDANESPVHQYSGPGSYVLQGTVVSDSGCTDVSEFLTIDIPPLPSSLFTEAVSSCDSLVSFTNLSQDAIAYRWNFGDGDSSSEISPSHIYALAGTIPVQLTSISSFGCESTFEKSVYFVSFKEARFSTGVDSCSGLVSFDQVTENAVYYHWDFGDGDTSSARLPVHVYSTDGKYTITLKVNNETSCLDSIQHDLKYELPLGERVFIPTAFTPNGDNVNDRFKIDILRPCDIYSLDVFNRWGELVYSSPDIAQTDWDGTTNGVRLPDGVYIFVVKGSTFQKRGVINLIR